MRPQQIPHRDWQPELGGEGIVGGLDDIDQCVRVILSTPLGSAPHRTDFGSDLHRYLDWPQDRAATYLVREVHRAIRRWEKRIVGLSVRVSHALAAVALDVVWQPVGGGEPRTTTVSFPL